MDNHRRYLSAIVIPGLYFPGLPGNHHACVRIVRRQAGQPRFKAPAISADGRFMAFMSIASNLVPETPTASGTSLFATLKKSTTLSAPPRV